MPVLATFIGSMASALVELFSKFMGYKLALKFASYTTWLAVLAAFLISVYVCLSSLFGMVSSGGGGGGSGDWVRLFWMGLGMFIPPNAGAVMSCIGSVWISTSIYRIQKHGIQNYSS